jgi:hypothetical protein
MQSKFYFPSFNKNTPNKISTNVSVTGTSVLKSPSNVGSFAISDLEIPANDEGRHIFALEIENRSSWPCHTIGFTTMKTFDSNKSVQFGQDGFTGVGLYIFNGNVRSAAAGDVNVIHPSIAKTAEEVIVILTITESYDKKLLQFIVNGESSDPVDVSDDLVGEFVYPAISLHSAARKVTVIPIDQCQYRRGDAAALSKEYEKSLKIPIGPSAPPISTMIPEVLAVKVAAKKKEKDEKQEEVAKTNIGDDSE